jgi:hypothetical protein
MPLRRPRGTKVGTLVTFNSGAAEVSSVSLSKTDQTTEMRSAVRFPLKLKIAVKADSGEHQAETRNISSAGVLFDVDTELVVGSNIEFSIAMPADVLGAPNDVLVNCQGRVMRCALEGGRRAVAAVIDEYRFERA